METSWPRGRYLIGLMDGISTSKRERVTVKALRASYSTLESKIAELQAEKDRIAADLRAQCTHPPERLRVEEIRFASEIGRPTRVQYLVECDGCLQTLRRRDKHE